jgi:amino acid permease
MRVFNHAHGIAVLLTALHFEPAISQFTIYQRNNNAIFWAVTGIAAVLLVFILIGGSLMLRHRH